MAYITREDGEKFVIPSYREVLSSRSKAALKKDILKLSESYGEYITLQPKGVSQYEVAFATEVGHLLGESVWHHFNRPLDMIYSEVIPDTQEAILVIVKSGSVYLDGSFPVDSIAEELVIFLTQENNFEIYIHGDVPIAKEPEEGKFSFEEASVKSFNILEDPVFPTLALLDIYKLQLVDNVLKQHGIGVLPIKEVVMGIATIAILYMAWSYLTYTPPPSIAQVRQSNPYQRFYSQLESPNPFEKLKFVDNVLNLANSMPGWTLASLVLLEDKITVSATSSGTNLQTLIDWAKAHDVVVDIKQDGVHLTFSRSFKNRQKPEHIYPLKDVTVKVIDNLNQVYQGNFYTLDKIVEQNVYQTRDIKISLMNISPSLIMMMAEQIKGLPLILKDLEIRKTGETLSGSITLEALGS